MPDALCRLTIHDATQDDGPTVDVALPSATEIDHLLPAIVDLMDRGGIGRHWQLSRLGGEPIDVQKSLSDNHIRDGDVLLLTEQVPPPPTWVVLDPCRMVAGQMSRARNPLAVSVIGCLLLTLTAAGLLLWTAGERTERLVTAVVLTLAAAVGAVALDRVRAASALPATLDVAAVAFAGVSGALAVPPGPVAGHVLLASAATFSACIVLMRLRSATVVLVSIATTALSVILVSLAAAVWVLSTTATAVALVTLALTMLTVAPRAAILLTGHRALTGIVVGASAATTLGAAVLAYAAASAASVALTVVVSLVLALRSRTHADALRRLVLAAGGSACLCAGLVTAAATWPDLAFVLGGTAAVVGGGVLLLAQSAPPSPTVRRTVDMVDCLAIGAVVPLACWVGGLFTLVRHLGLM